MAGRGEVRNGKLLLAKKDLEHDWNSFGYFSYYKIVFFEEKNMGSNLCTPENN